MNRIEHLMVIAMEECTEVGQRLSKALRFGLDQTQDGQEYNNRERIMVEFDDLVAAIEMLRDEINLRETNNDAVQGKKNKVERYLEWCREKLGTLTD